jgi:hypothetical protein
MKYCLLFPVGMATLLVEAALLLSGCSSKTTTNFNAPQDPTYTHSVVDNSEYVNKMIPSWIGHKASELIAAWGKPSDTGILDPDSYGGRGGISFSYKIGDNGSTIEIPRTALYADSLGSTLLDTSAIVPHFVFAYFATDKNGVIIDDGWFGSFTDEVIPSRYPMPALDVTLAFPLNVDIEPNRHGGNWSEPASAGKIRDQVDAEKWLKDAEK